MTTGLLTSQVERVFRAALVSFLVALFSGTLADLVTRNFTKDANVIALMWLVLAGVTTFVYRTRLKSKDPANHLFELSNTMRQWVGRIAIFAAIAAVLLATLPHKDPVFLLAKVVAILIAIGGGIGYWVASDFTSKATPVAEVANAVKSQLLAGCALVAGLLASMTYRTSTDDFYYVNMSTYIFNNGQVPVRDTVLSDQYFNGYARLSSWEVLWGVLARISHVHPAVLLYMVFIPFATALSIYVLAKLMETAGIKHVNLALVTTTIFLIFDGVQGFTFGAYQGPRIWQGKSFFLAVLLPLILILILRLLRSANETDAILLGAVVVASLGATTTTFIIGLPMLGVALFVAFMNRNKRAVIGLGASMAYLLTSALVFRGMLNTADSTNVAAFGHGYGIGIHTAKYSTHDSMPQSFDMLTKLSGPAWHAALFGFASILGWVALRGKFARELVALNIAAWGLISSPVLVTAYMTLTGSAPIAWRYIWLVPIPMLIGATASALYEGAVFGIKSLHVRRVIAGLWIAAWVVFPMTIGTPPWKIAPGSLVSADLSKPAAYRVGFGYAQAEKALHKVAHEGDIVLARNGISASINTQTTKFYTVGLRPVYVGHATNGFKDGFAQQRTELGLYVGNLTDKPTLTKAQLARNLKLVRVNVVCIAKEQKSQISTFKSLGYTQKQAKVTKSDGRIWVWCGRTNEFDK